MNDMYQFKSQIPGWSGEGAESRDVFSPYSGEKVGSVLLVNEDGARIGLAAAKQAFSDRSRWLPAHKRGEILKKVSGLILERHEALSRLIALEGGKPLSDARVEVTRAANTVELAAEEATRLHGTHIPLSGTSAAMGRMAFSYREPIGVVMAISAFNHPLNLIAHQVAPAVAAGCPVLVKPAGVTPLSCMLFIDMLREAGLPPELAMGLPCKNDVAEWVATHRDVAFLTFIGSGRVGWHLRSKVAPGTRCALEHGGIAPIIIDKGVDLERAVPLLLKGGFYHAGQVCVSIQRIIVHNSLRAALLEALKTGAEKLKVGDPSIEQTEVGPLIRQGEVERVASWVKEAVDGGARLICGGKVLGNQCYAATILDGPPAGSKVLEAEIFGPVVCVQGFEDLDEAISLANMDRYSFQSAILSPDVDRAFLAANQLEAGTVMINDHTAFRVDWMPFAGRRESGLAVGGVGYSMEDMTQEKLIVLKAPGLVG